MAFFVVELCAQALEVLGFFGFEVALSGGFFARALFMVQSVGWVLVVLVRECGVGGLGGCMGCGVVPSAMLLD